MGGAIVVGYLLAAGATFLLFVGLVAGLAYRFRERWIGKPGEVRVEGGAFRSASVKTDPKRQRRQWLILGTSISSIALAVGTIFFLAPAGALGALVMNGDDPIFWTSIGVASLDALPLAAMLIASAVLLARRSPAAYKLGIAAGAYSLLHHGGLVLMAVVLFVHEDYSHTMSVFTGSVALLGAFHGLMIVMSALLSRRDV